MTCRHLQTYYPFPAVHGQKNRRAVFWGRVVWEGNLGKFTITFCLNTSLQKMNKSLNGGENLPAQVYPCALTNSEMRDQESYDHNDSLGKMRAKWFDTLISADIYLKRSPAANGWQHSFRLESQRIVNKRRRTNDCHTSFPSHSRIVRPSLSCSGPLPRPIFVYTHRAVSP
jgi:hypothetical protein